jgi:hypothetical protein
MRSLALLAIAAAGCYSSYGWTPDAGAPPDTGVDTHVDTGVDTIEDTATDTPEDTAAPDGEGLCGEIESPLLAFSFIVDDLGVADDADFERTCRAPTSTGASSDRTFTFSCDGPGGGTETHTLRILTTPGAFRLPAPAGDVVLRVRQRGVDISFAYRWITIRSRAGDLLMAGMMGKTLAPEPDEPLEWYAPVLVEPFDGSCPIETPGCYDIERTAVRVTCGGSTGLFFEDQRGYVGESTGCYVHVGESFHCFSVHCAGMEVPSTYHSVLIVP